MEKCKCCKKKVQKGDWYITFGEVTDWEDGEPIALCSKVNYYCKKCFKKKIGKLLN